MNIQPLVSVCMITFNQEAFIAEAIEGVLMQKLDQPLELVIGDDKSTDNTRIICQKYVTKYPGKIRLLPSIENMGMIKNFIRTYQASRGKYIAICEGDDYWFHPHKLDRQVKFLEQNSQYSICTHNTKLYFQDTDEFVESTRGDCDYELKNFLFWNVTGKHSCSIVFKNSKHMQETIESEIFSNTECGDWLVSFAALMEGKMRFLGDSMGVYRIHDNSVFSSKNWLEQFRMHVSGALAIDALTKHEFQDVIINRNLHRLFSDAIDEDGELRISDELLYKYYSNLDNKIWRKLTTKIFLKHQSLRDFFLRNLVNFLFKKTEPN